MGLDVLLAIGTDMALMHLHGISQRVKYKGIKAAANERIEQLARDLGLTKEQLADRLVPELGLSDDGALELDFGPRQFTVSFDEALKPILRDGAGKLRKSLPKPAKSDDASLAEKATARFKQLKKDVRTVAKLQVDRLKKAMIAARRWSVADFDRFLVQHPLMVHLARRVVWGVYDAQGVCGASFRVTEDRSLADAEDEAYTLSSEGRVGIVHPADVPDGVLAAWGELFADYELLQPFTQLARPVYRLTDEERSGKRLERHRGKKVPVAKVMGLKGRGFQMGEAMDGGGGALADLPLPDGEHVARLLLGDAGVWIGAMSYQTRTPASRRS